MSGTTTLRWLHFTDLHVGQKDMGLWPSAKQAILDDLRRTTTALGPWDVVIFTGDLAYSGKKSEYAKLDVELKEIWALFAELHPGAKLPILLAVPGNHDLVWPKSSDSVAHQLLSEQDSGREALWSGEKQQLTAVKKWFRDYGAWWDGCQLRPPAGLTAGLLPGDFTWTLEKDGVRFAFVGVNSAFTQMSGGVKEGQLWIDPRQIKGACGGDPLAWVRDRNFAFLLTHHPPGWLTPDAHRRYAGEIAPAGLFTGHFCGHLHESLARQTRVGRGAAREIWQGASLFGMEKAAGGTIQRKHGYTAGHLEVLADGSARTTLWPRLGVRRQDESWAITADVTYQLDGDLLATSTEPAQTGGKPVRRTRAPSPASLPPAITVPVATTRSWREAVEQSALWPVGAEAAALAQAKRVALDIVSVCWNQWQAAEREAPGDPWRDEELPLRTVARVEALVGPGDLSPQETALLFAAPFVFEGLFAAGACWLAEELSKDEPGNRGHELVNDMHAARPDLVRRRDKLTGTARAAVDYWLMTRALRQCPQLWEEKPSLKEARAFMGRIGDVTKSAGAQGWMLLHRLVQLARHVGVSPDVFEAEGTIDRERVIEVDGGSLRLAALARLLCAAGAWALDLRRADDLVADHAGREGFEVVTARDAIRAARWEPGKDVHSLVQSCADPVVDFVLRNDLVTRADQVVRRLAEDRVERPALSGGLLDGLPPGLRADITIQKGPDGRQPYRVPHVRFQLDHNQVRELLMGEQLYGDPTLAVRELYQNALDACRYRKARADFLDETYEGRIVFRQDVDTEKGAYIECEDNGVGMTAGILEHVFAVAGKRFKDMPEYLEERARWNASGKNIELHPNSRFGIGVLSYFMLADDVKVWTRRFKPEGTLGDPILVHISGASGLFRVEEVAAEGMPESGTRVRLYLKKTTYEHLRVGVRRISCREILGELLWVAEFATTAQEKGEEFSQWHPGVPCPGGKAAPASMYLPTESKDVWWAACTRDLGEQTGREDVPLLVDGVRTQTYMTGTLLNLRAGRCRNLSVDRNAVLAWDREWADDVRRRSLTHLMEWGGLTMMFLWDMVSYDRPLAKRLVDSLSEHDARVPIALPINLNGRQIASWTVRVAESGVLPGDETFVPDVRGKVPVGTNLFAAWRTMVLCKSRVPAGPRREHVDRMPVVPADPDDPDILRLAQPNRTMGRGYDFHGRHLVFSALDVLATSLRQRRSVSDIVTRIRAYEFLGYELDLCNVPPLDLENIRTSPEKPAAVLESLLRQYGSPSGTEFGPVDILRLLFDSSAAARDVVKGLALLASLGVRVAAYDFDLFDSLRADREVLRIFSYNLDAQAPWLTGEIPTCHLLHASKQLAAPLPAMMQRLRRFEPLGIRLPQIDLDRMGELSPADWKLLSRDLDGSWPWLGSRVPLAHLARVARDFGITMGEAMRRLEKLLWTGIVLPAVDPGDLDALGLAEPKLQEVAARFQQTELRASEIATAAGTAGSFAAALRIVTRLGIPCPHGAAFETLGPDAQPRPGDATILSSFEGAPGNDPTTRLRRGRATARFKIWEPADADLDAAIARLRPVIDVIVQGPKP